MLPGSDVLPKNLPFFCKSVGVICSEGVKWCKSWAAMGGLLGITPRLKLPCKNGLQWGGMGGLQRNHPPPLPPPPRLKLPWKSGLQWAAMGGLFRNYPSDWNCHVRVGYNGLKWEDFSAITPHDYNCHVKVGCSGLQWEDFSGITPWLKLPM